LAKRKPNQDEFLLQPNVSHLILHTIVTLSLQDCSNTITSIFHQFCCRGTKSQSAQLGYAKTQPRSFAFATKHLTPHFGCICENSPPRLLTNHDFTFSPILLARHKKQIHPIGEAKTQPRSIPFGTKRFTPHCAYICDTFPPRLLTHHDFTFSPILLPRHKKPIHPTWLSKNPT